MDTTLQVPSTVAPLPRSVFVAAGVLVLHVAALWALQSGLLRRAAEVVVPVELLSSLVVPAAPRAETPPPPRPAVAPVPLPVPVQRRQAPVAPSPPRPVAVPDAAPTPSAPLGATEVQAATPPVAEPVAAAPAAVPTPAPATVPAPVHLPSSDADYLQNPKPVYPAMSRRLGEQGKVVVRVLIGVDGSAQAAELRQSSGHPRLDQAALDVVRQWRYVPGKRGGVPEPMWFNVPITFVLQ